MTGLDTYVWNSHYETTAGYELWDRWNYFVSYLWALAVGSRAWYIKPTR